MTRLMLALGLTAMTASLASAQEAAMPEDTDGDGIYALEELQTAHPELTAEVYATLDSNGDGNVDAAEVAAAMEAGVLMAPG
ncbi:EF-hand domain-containing protein [Frigidibacter sp. ROC022]|uniref:EF-hand domain-containing protein n=1 Tax=Frigidibacter sp. ROC022 TaxID=2971796 RepID=UPI00215B2E61|nr:EF-hand domain-containing protein [Frigidibacter sp. ROC022]MCR8725596.1 EF-hand domain-containing protein [Frigidibacter sp. ROC022]